MKSKAPLPQEWQTLRRLRAARCPIDYDHIAPPDYPLRVTSPPCELPTQIFPSENGIGIALYLRIAASASMTICGWRFEAGWLQSEVSWIEPCSKHLGFHCLHRTPDRSVQFASASVLNRRVFHAGVLKRGSFLRGFLVGTTTSPLPLTLPRRIEGTLYVEDLYGVQHPYTVALNSGTCLA